MRTEQETKQINDFLGRAGFAQLDEPRALIQQLAYTVRDEAHFRSLLTRCDPAERRHMYEAMRPHLNFTPQPLDVYVAEAAREAELRQLPTVDAAGFLHPFRAAPDIKSDAYKIEKAFLDHAAKHRLVLTCRKCTRQEEFKGIRKHDAIADARNTGWTYDEINGTGIEICPTCPGGGATAKHLN